ncbi:acyl-CoA-like ligand-binding transcription factor [Streptomyces sp. S186]|uniref:acyl-CoA-like ligand-binding transcription factor n=1 Tax=Streptomyces sp. S186 TaxID=3434395 RepID=UPI003F66D063
MLAARTGAAEDSMEVRLLACALIDAVSVAVEHWAGQDEPGDVTELTWQALACLQVDELQAATRG